MWDYTFSFYLAIIQKIMNFKLSGTYFKLNNQQSESRVDLSLYLKLDRECIPL